MLFWLKKFVSFWLTPLSICMLGFVVGLWLLRTPRRARLGRGILLGATFLLYGFGNPWVSGLLLRPLEAPYRPIPELNGATNVPAALARCRYVVVLGSGNHYEHDYSPNNLLWAPSLARIVEGTRLLKALPDARLVVSGAGIGDRESHARVMGRAAIALGVASSRIDYLDTARDTDDEARGIARLAAGQPVALVTSAWHMRRALALMERSGVGAVPCPTDYNTCERVEVTYSDFLWGVQALGGSSLGLRERIGLGWVWLRAKFG